MQVWVVVIRKHSGTVQMFPSTLLWAVFLLEPYQLFQGMRSLTHDDHRTLLL